MMKSALMTAMTLLFGTAFAVDLEVVKSNFGVQIYGRLKADMSYDTARTDTGNFARWVESEGSEGSDDLFNLTARESRLGVNLSGPDTESIKTTGKVEIDFYEGGTENKAQFMMRHCYIQAAWPELALSLLAGQTSDIFSPLAPSTLNYSVGWWVGNIGYRRPQVRLSKTVTATDDVKLGFDFGPSRTIGDDWGNDPGDTGEDSGFPTLQGRASVSFPALASLVATAGISGHWGQEEYDPEAEGSSEDFNSWSVDADLTLPLHQKVTLKAEGFTGMNLDTYLGGIGQGVNRTEMDEISSLGGWAAVDVKPVDKWTCGVGVGMDNPNDGDLNKGDKTQNVTTFGNVKYDITKALCTGLEISYWNTQYKDKSTGDSVRFQTSLIYTF